MPGRLIAPSSAWRASIRSFASLGKRERPGPVSSPGSGAFLEDRGVNVWIWLGFCTLVAALFALDLALFNRGGGEISLRRAAWWSVGWTALGALLALPLLFLTDGTTVQEYLTGFLIEKSLSTDNLFVFALILGYFSIPKQSQRRVLFWGIVGALFLRAVFIFAGAALLNAFQATIYVFGALLIITGIRMWRQDDVKIDPEKLSLIHI